jgi:hypothetical protein
MKNSQRKTVEHTKKTHPYLLVENRKDNKKPNECPVNNNKYRCSDDASPKCFSPVLIIF